MNIRNRRLKYIYIYIILEKELSLSNVQSCSICYHSLIKSYLKKWVNNSKILNEIHFSLFPWSFKLLLLNEILYIGDEMAGSTRNKKNKMTDSKIRKATK